MARVLLGDLRTGRNLVPLPVSKGSATPALNSAGSIQATVTVTNRDVKALDLRSTATTPKALIAWEENDSIIEAGPLWSFHYDRDEGTLDLNGAGLWSYLDHRVVVPTAAATTTSFFINDPDNFDTMIPNPALDTVFKNMSYGTMAKRLLQQMQTWPASDLPIVYQDDDTGTASRTVAALDFQYIGDALRDITELDDGVDIQFAPRRTVDRLGIEWVLRTGTTANPDLGT